MIRAYLNMWRQCTNFKGRTSRREFWLAYACNILIVVVASLVLGIICGIGYWISDGLGDILGMITNAITSIYSIAEILPLAALAVRRLHDTNKPGYIYVLCALGSCCCGIGIIVFLVLASMPGTAGTNAYGPDPNGYNGQNNFNGYNGQNNYNQSMYNQNQNNYNQNQNMYNQNPNNYNQNNFRN